MTTGMVYAQFDNLSDAQEWRKIHGGWLFTVNDTAVFWSCKRFTQSQIIVHPSNAGLSGVLV